MKYIKEKYTSPQLEIIEIERSFAQEIENSGDSPSCAPENDDCGGGTHWG